MIIQVTKALFPYMVKPQEIFIHCRQDLYYLYFHVISSKSGEQFLLTLRNISPRIYVFLTFSHPLKPHTYLTHMGTLSAYINSIEHIYNRSSVEYNYFWSLNMCKISFLFFPLQIHSHIYLISHTLETKSPLVSFSH